MNKHVFKRVCAIFLTISICILSALNQALAQPESLLAEAIAARNSINSNVPLQQRINQYRAVFENIDALLERYPDSQEAIAINTGQQIGNFDVAQLRSEFIQELSNYYKEICEVSPNLECIAFVSLESGISQCGLARVEGELDQAHSSIENAISIFSRSGADSMFTSLALSEYRLCLGRSGLRSSTSSKDRYQLRLAELLSVNGSLDSARAIVESMTDPAAIVRGAMILDRANNDSFAQSTADRLNRYLNENVSTSVTRNFLSVEIYLETLKRGATAGTDRVPHLSEATKEDCSWSGHRLSLAVELMRTLAAQEKYADVRTVPDRLELSSCSEGKYIISKIYSYLLIENHKTAEQFLVQVISGYWDATRGIQYFISHISESEDQFFYYYDAVGKARSHPLDLDSIFLHDAARLPIFRTLVNFGYKCEAIDMVFNEFSGNEEFPVAIAYVTDNPEINLREGFSCGGDESLEILLK